MPNELAVSCCTNMPGPGPPAASPSARPTTASPGCHVQCRWPGPCWGLAPHLRLPVDHDQPLLDGGLQPCPAGSRQPGGQERIQAQLALHKVAARGLGLRRARRLAKSRASGGSGWGTRERRANARAAERCPPC